MPPCAIKCAICGAIFDAPSLRQQLAEIEKKVGDPNVWADQEKSQVLMRQRRRLEESLAMDADRTISRLTLTWPAKAKQWWKSCARKSTSFGKWPTSLKPRR